MLGTVDRSEETNAIRRPSGDQAGSVPAAIIRRRRIPSVFQMAKLPPRSLAKAIQFPSGDHVGCQLVTATPGGGAASAANDASTASASHMLTMKAPASPSRQRAK